MDKKTTQGLKAAGIALILIMSSYFLGEDYTSFLKWWIAVLLLGIGCFPLTSHLCSHFHDRGWAVSKVIGIAISGFFVWLLGNCKIIPFTGTSSLIVAILTGAACWGTEIFLVKRKKKQGVQKLACPLRDKDTLSGILDSELIFLLFFLLWTYFAGFKPEARGTEKFMDYGFMMAMMRSSEIPAPDPWYAGEALNYYYGGQYFAVFLTKLTGTYVKETYHLMRSLVAGFAFVLPFTVVRQMVLDSGKNVEENAKQMTAIVKGRIAVLGGILAGVGVSFSGNMHYVMVGKVLPWIREVFHLPKGEYDYWFPNSTRYIGYYPEGNDKTIHEFPSYSFVLGDLHAHVVNIMFVLAVIVLTYAMIQHYAYRREKEILTTADGGQNKSMAQAVRETLLEPYVLLFAFFIGLFHWTNYWDFVIYYVMGGMGVIYANYIRMSGLPTRKERLLHTLLHSIIHSVEVFVLSTVFALPFTLQFKTMVTGIALAQNHSRPYQWWLIWGLPFLFTVFVIFCLFKEKGKENPLPAFHEFYAVILGISAIGLIIIPEIVYVRDIYEDGYARSNTMFKLTYQAFTMFCIAMAYGFIRMWIKNKTKIKKILTSAAFVCFVACSCYGITAVHSWFGEVWNKSSYQGLDATAYLEGTFPEDAAAIRWLENEVEGSPVVLEANGNSYTDNARVSAMTGLPTILGWYVHEWLWRSETSTLDTRIADIKTIYTSPEQQTVRELIDQYQVEYIFVGKMEKESFPELNDSMIRSLGETVFEDASYGTYIVKVAE